MNNIKFPKRPLYLAKWMSFHIEPIIGTGERICFAVCALSQDGLFAYYETLDDTLIHAMFKEKAQNINAFLSINKEYLFEHIKKGNSMQEFKPPLTGLYICKIKDAADLNMTGIIKQAIMESSCLVSRTAFNLPINYETIMIGDGDKPANKDS